MAKVYVSSTIVDLDAERQAVIDWLVAAQHQVVHSYRPNSDTVRDSCLADVDTCDLYVLILGHRYGFQPPEDNPEGLSITQLEFRRAGQSGKPRVALLRTSIPDISLSDMADPQRLALVQAFREEVADAVRAAEFGDLRELVQGLSTGVPAELDKLQAKRAELEKAQAERAELAKPPPGPVRAGRVLRLAPRPPFLAGREDLLAELEARLGGGDGRGRGWWRCTGWPGRGRPRWRWRTPTRTPREDGITWQFAAEDPAVLAAGFTELAAALGAREGRDPVASVHQVLAGAAAGWLLVFDNVPGPEAVEALVPPAWRRAGADHQPQRAVAAGAEPGGAGTGPGGCGGVPGRPHRRRRPAGVGRAWPRRWAGCRWRWSRPPPTPRPPETAWRLPGVVPRAAGGPAGPGRGRPGMAGRWQPRGRWRSASWRTPIPGAAGLLRLLAFCAPEAVPLRLLLRPRPGLAGQLSPQVAETLAPLLEDELAAGDAIAALRRYSLVRPAGDGAVSVHRLVQAITADQMPAQLAQAWRQAATAVVEAALPGDPEQPGTWPVFAALLPHAQAALPADSGGMARVASYLGQSGSYVAARELSRGMLEERAQVLGAEDPGTLNARAHLAYWTGAAGDAAGARDQYATLLPIRERVSGAEHPHTLNARAGLARWTGEAGDAAGARDQYAVLLPIFERVSGAEHPDTLNARGSLARWTGEAGDAAGARDQYAVLLPIFERVSGAEHPGTLTARGHLAYWTGEAGDAAGARDQYAVLLPIQERVLGAEHPETLNARGNLAYWTGAAGDAAGARDQFAVLLPIQERVLGAEHPDTLNARGHLAYWTKKAAGGRGSGVD